MKLSWEMVPQPRDVPVYPPFPSLAIADFASFSLVLPFPEYPVSGITQFTAFSNLALWATCDEDLCMSFQAWWVCSAVWRYGSSPALHILRRTHWLISVVGSYEQFVDQIFVWVQVFSVWETKQAVGDPVSFWLHLHVYLYQRESLLLSPQCKSARFMASKPAYHQPASFSSLIQLHSSIGFTLPLFHYSSEFYMFSVSSCHFKWDGVVEWE